MSNELSTFTNPLDALKATYPQDAGDLYERKHLPQVRFKAKTVLDDNEKVVHKAGTFVTVRRSDEKVGDTYDYIETPIGAKVTGDIVYSRYQLSFYDSANNAYVSSPIFDDKEKEIVTLFKGKEKIASGTVAELQALPQFQVVKEDKTTTALKLNKVLYVLIDGVLHEMSMGGGNIYAYGTYTRELKKVDQTPTSVHTEFNSEKTEHGGNKYNQMVFTNTAELTIEEATKNVEVLKDLLEGITAEKAYYGTKFAGDSAPAIAPAGDDF
jgi:hypothetical protein